MGERWGPGNGPKAPFFSVDDCGWRRKAGTLFIIPHFPDMRYVEEGEGAGHVLPTFAALADGSFADRAESPVGQGEVGDLGRIEAGEADQRGISLRSTSSMPDSTRAASVSRTLEGPSATRTLAPKR